MSEQQTQNLIGDNHQQQDLTITRTTPQEFPQREDFETGPESLSATASATAAGWHSRIDPQTRIREWLSNSDLTRNLQKLNQLKKQTNRSNFDSPPLTSTSTNTHRTTNSSASALSDSSTELLSSTDLYSTPLHKTAGGTTACQPGPTLAYQMTGLDYKRRILSSAQNQNLMFSAAAGMKNYRFRISFIYCWRKCLGARRFRSLVLVLAALSLVAIVLLSDLCPGGDDKTCGGSSTSSTPMARRLAWYAAEFKRPPILGWIHHNTLASDLEIVRSAMELSQSKREQGHVSYDELMATNSTAGLPGVGGGGPTAVVPVPPFNIGGDDVIVFLHIQKTGGTVFGRHLVRDLDLDQPCECKRGKKRCRCFRPVASTSLSPANSSAQLPPALPQTSQHQHLDPALAAASTAAASTNFTKSKNLSAVIQSNDSNKTTNLSSLIQNLIPNSIPRSQQRIWLFSRYSTGWRCGLHADWTELTHCVDHALDEHERADRQRRYFYVTLLRDPIARFLSEFKHVQRGATWKTALHWCGGREATQEELPFCFPEADDWSDVSLDEFLACPYNLAFNRQTRMLADLQLVNCYNSSGLMPLERRDAILLASAKENLRRMSFFGLCEFQNVTQYLFERAFGLRFLRPFVQFSETHSSASLREGEVTPSQLDLILQRNALDLELYRYAKELLLGRLAAVKAQDPVGYERSWKEMVGRSPPPIPPIGPQGLGPSAKNPPPEVSQPLFSDLTPPSHSSNSKDSNHKNQLKYKMINAEKSFKKLSQNPKQQNKQQENFPIAPTHFNDPYLDYLFNANADAL